MIRREEFTGRTVSLINRTEPETDRKKNTRKKELKAETDINQSVNLFAALYIDYAMFTKYMLKRNGSGDRPLSQSWQVSLEEKSRS